MKKILSHIVLIAAIAIFSASAMAQNSFSYQAVIRNNGEVVSNQDVSLLISILNGSDVYYQEIQKVKTNAYGNISVSVGEGEPKTGSFATIPWETMQVMMQVEVSTDGSENYVNLGQMQIQPVPYAIYAARTATVIQPAAASEDPIFEVRDNNGELMFAVYENGVKVYVDQDGTKAAKSKFAVAGRSASKGEENLLTINSEGTTVYVDENANKAAKSKFAVAGRSAGKTDTDLLAIDNSGSTIYVDGDGKAAKSRFAVAGRSGKSKKSNNNYSIDNDNSTLYVDFNDNAAGKGAQADVLTIDGGQATFYIDETEDGKAAKSKFAVAGRSADKSVQTAFVIDGTGTLIYIDDNGQSGKAAKSKFAVAGRSSGKGDSKFFSITPDSTRIYVNDEVDNTNNGSLAASFAIVGMTQNTDLLFINKDSTVIKANTYVAEEMQSATGEVNKLDVVYGVWSGSLKYKYHRADIEEQQSDTIIDYCFTNFGRDNFEGFVVDDFAEGRGKYKYIYNASTSNSLSIDNTSGVWTWESNQWYPISAEIMTCPMFSLEGVNTEIGWPITEYSSIANIQGGDINIEDIVKTGTEKYSIGNTSNQVDVDVYSYNDKDDNTTCTFYVYNGIVLYISKKSNNDAALVILECIEFNRDNVETSFAHWLKKGGVTNFSGIASRYIGEEYSGGHYFVDLKLPSGNLWASCNVGAPTSFDLGSYLAWGELEEKASYEEAGYSVTELNSDNDAAYQWGIVKESSDWCMPTNADWQELIDECVWIWVKDEKGVYVTYDESLSERKGEKLVINSIDELRWDYSIELINFIYLPAAGFFDYSNINNTGQGYYWSSNKQDYGVNCLVFGESYQQIGNNPGYQGLQVRPVMHKSKTYWVKKPEGTPTGEATGSSNNPFTSINEALSTITNDFERNSDALMTYTIMVNGNVEPAEISAPTRIKQITLCGANGLNSSGEPQDAIVGNINTRPLTVNYGNIVIKNLKLTGGGINPENPDEPSLITNGGGLCINRGTATLDNGAFVMNNSANSSGGGVYIEDYGNLMMRSGSKICNNTAGSNGDEGLGGGVYACGDSDSQSSDFTMLGGEISGNKCVGYSIYNNIYCFSKGAGVYFGSIAYFTMLGGSITNNVIEEPDVEVSEGQTIINGTGGGVYCDGYWSYFSMYGGEISNNTAAVASDMYMIDYYGNYSLSGTAYISNIHFNFNNNQNATGFSVTNTLTTNRTMDLTLENVAEDGNTTLFQYSTDVRDNGFQSTRNVLSKFNLKNTEYSIGNITENQHSDNNSTWYVYSVELVPQSK